MEGVHAVEHVAAVLVVVFAGCQEVEAGLVRGDLVVCVSCFDLETRGRTLEDGSEELARWIRGCWVCFL